MEHIVSDKKPLVYWHKYDEPKKVINFFGKEEIITGEYKCDNPLVERAWYWGSIGYQRDNSVAISRLSFILKDGTRKDFDQTENDHMQQAEKWLQEIENK